MRTTRVSTKCECDMGEAGEVFTEDPSFGGA